MRIDADWAAEHGGPTARHIADAHNKLADEFDELKKVVDALEPVAKIELPGNGANVLPTDKVVRRAETKGVEQ